MTKRAIETAAVAGLPIDGHAVVSVSKTRRSLTYRHAWLSDTDGRIWADVSAAARGLAREIASETGRSVEIFGRCGCLYDEIGGAS